METATRDFNILQTHFKVAIHPIYVTIFSDGDSSVVVIESTLASVWTTSLKCLGFVQVKSNTYRGLPQLRTNHDRATKIATTKNNSISKLQMKRIECHHYIYIKYEQ